MRIYLAGPDVFLPNAREILDRKIAICAEHGFVGVSPFDAALEPPPATRDGARTISARNEELMRSCDLVIANMTPFRGPSMDVGTAYEMGFMRALGRPVLGYSNVADRLHERTVRLCGGRESKGAWADADGMLIEDFGLGDNLMVDVAVMESGAGIVRRTTASEARFTDLDAFADCVKAASSLVTHRR